MDKNYIQRRKRSPVTRLKLGLRTRLLTGAMRRFLSRRAPDILDAGCCDGAVLEALRQALPAGRAVGVDNEPEFLAACRPEGVELLQMDIEKGLEFAPGTFDAVTATSVIEHLSDGAFFLAEARRVLKDDGFLFLVSVIPLYERLLCLLRFKPSDHYRNYTKSALERGARDAGYRKVVLSRRYPFTGYQLLVAQK